MCYVQVSCNTHHRKYARVNVAYIRLHCCQTTPVMSRSSICLFMLNPERIPCSCLCRAPISLGQAIPLPELAALISTKHPLLLVQRENEVVEELAALARREVLTRKLYIGNTHEVMAQEGTVNNVRKKRQGHLLHLQIVLSSLGLAICHQVSSSTSMMPPCAAHATAGWCFCQHAPLDVLCAHGHAFGR
jgi:hypothetical protein